MAEPRHPAFELAKGFLGAPRFSAALTQVIIGSQLATLLLHELMGWAGALAILGGLVVLASFSLLAQREEIEWHGLLPISLLVFVGWATISVFWSQYNWATAGSAIYLLAVTMLGIYVALIRDTIQIARAFGNVLRGALLLSLVLEIFSGVLIDSPIHFLAIAGNLDVLGPIQGIFGTRNQLGIVTLVAIVTFGTELRTRSVPRNLAIGSLVLGGLTLLLARSPIAFGTLMVVMLATLALYGLRRVSSERKRIWQFVLLGSTITVGTIAWAVRTPIINALSASNELNQRLAIWRPIRLLIPTHELEGWGWAGHWWEGIPPFTYIRDGLQPSGLNAYLDVWFQVGLIGLFAFVFMLGLAFIRSWLLASRQRSFVYAWPALVLVVLLVTGLAESSLLVEFGWLTFVVCSVKASRELSWRKAFAAIRVPSGMD
ncbi:exopolysaccharide biosynthesis protein [Glaciihabitans sp. INWT7]|uniref:O-antigen ligase family protein n=1 Tax=Glaciihabitans sp. INWT7 TaxID=2596912 RepID=UPI0016293A68|nr:exopolysaccharide biosynthesis protein [Glaciihabitans sp. INWT7]QNE45998.1 exopolysaccharide biosynthesis protein [Glaciihabitans sp. INWT7]